MRLFSGLWGFNQFLTGKRRSAGIGFISF